MEEAEAGGKVGGKRKRILDVTSSQLPESPAPVLLEAPAPALPESRESVLPESRASMLPGSRALSRDFFVFLSDAMSVLEATAEDKLPRLPKSLHGVGQHKRVALQWVPAHCSLPGNEEADDRARQSWSQRKTTRQQRHLPQKRRPSSEQPRGNALRGRTSTSVTGGSRLWSRDYARVTPDSMPTCSRK